MYLEDRKHIIRFAFWTDYYNVANRLKGNHSRYWQINKNLILIDQGRGDCSVDYSIDGKKKNEQIPEVSETDRT